MGRRVAPRETSASSAASRGEQQRVSGFAAQRALQQRSGLHGRTRVLAQEQQGLA